MSDDILPIERQMEIVEQRYGSFENYKVAFAALDERQRMAELVIFDRSFGEEKVLPSKAYAEYWHRRRQLGGIDDRLRSAGR